jgi:hypothetical protein
LSFEHASAYDYSRSLQTNLKIIPALAMTSIDLGVLCIILMPQPVLGEPNPIAGTIVMVAVTPGRL